MKQFFSLLKNYITGEFAYQNYLSHHQKNHASTKALSKKEFLQKRLRAKFNKISRCC